MKDLLYISLFEQNLWTLLIEGFIPANLDTGILGKPFAETPNVKDYLLTKNINDSDYWIYFSIFNWPKFGSQIKDEYSPVNSSGFYKRAFIFCIGLDRDITHENLSSAAELVKFVRRSNEYNAEELNDLQSLIRKHFDIALSDFINFIY